jgi:hypothetical protein
LGKGDGGDNGNRKPDWSLISAIARTFFITHGSAFQPVEPLLFLYPCFLARICPLTENMEFITERHCLNMSSEAYLQAKRYSHWHRVMLGADTTIRLINRLEKPRPYCSPWSCSLIWARQIEPICVDSLLSEPLLTSSCNAEGQLVCKVVQSFEATRAFTAILIGIKGLFDRCCCLTLWPEGCRYIWS